MGDCHDHINVGGREVVGAMSLMESGGGVLSMQVGGG